MKCGLKTHSEQKFCCAGCGRAFASMTPFDWHRQGTGTRTCVDPAEAVHSKTGEPLFRLRAVKGEDVPLWSNARKFGG